MVRIGYTTRIVGGRIVMVQSGARQSAIRTGVQTGGSVQWRIVGGRVVRSRIPIRVGAGYTTKVINGRMVRVRIGYTTRVVGGRVMVVRAGAAGGAGMRVGGGGSVSWRLVGGRFVRSNTPIVVRPGYQRKMVNGRWIMVRIGYTYRMVNGRWTMVRSGAAGGAGGRAGGGGTVMWRIVGGRVVRS